MNENEHAYWKGIVLDVVYWYMDRLADDNDKIKPTEKQIDEIVKGILNDNYLWVTIDQFVLEHIKKVVNDGNN